jgi:hypothetical protein
MNEIDIQSTKDRKNYFDKISIKARFSLRKYRNYFANARPINRFYIFGWILFFVSFSLWLTKTIPVIFLLSVLFIIFVFILKQKKLFYEGLKETYLLIDIYTIPRIVLVLLIIPFGYYLLFVFGYFDNPYFKYFSNINNSINSVLLLSIFFFVICFLYDVFIFWQSRSSILNPILKILVAVSSFVSAFLSRWIIIDFTGVEPASFSASFILFSIVFGILFWIFLSIGFSVLIYFLTIIVGWIIALFSSFLSSMTSIRNSSFWRFLCRKPKDNSLFDKSNKRFFEFFLYDFGRAFGAISFGLLGIYILSFLYAVILVYGTQFDYLVEQMIVYSDYRSNANITECSNLNNDERGLLVGNQKISVAKLKPQGGYSFSTQLCKFEGKSHLATNHKVSKIIEITYTKILQTIEKLNNLLTYISLI